MINTIHIGNKGVLGAILVFQENNDIFTYDIDDVHITLSNYFKLHQADTQNNVNIITKYNIKLNQSIKQHQFNICRLYTTLLNSTSFYIDNDTIIINMNNLSANDSVTNSTKYYGVLKIKLNTYSIQKINKWIKQNYPM